jgi:hypothetical protein
VTPSLARELPSLASGVAARHDRDMSDKSMSAGRGVAAAVVAALLLLLSGTARAGDGAPPVVVELFTSQGCSSCPPADQYLGELAQRPGVLALEYHVDYWNYIGWTDPFASEAATRRQRDYAHQLALRFVYTPQMVVNGNMQGVGSDRDAIGGLIRMAEAQRAPEPALAVTRTVAGGIAVHVGPAVAPGAVKTATLWLLRFDRERTTEVPRGENGGRSLTNYQIVRSIRSIGSWSGEALDVTLAPGDLAGLGDAGVAVLLQTDGTGPIIAATMLRPGV